MVRRRGVHTLTCYTHIFQLAQFVCAHPHSLHACAHTRMAQVSVKEVLCTCVIPLQLAFSSVMSHPSLLFLDGHFETIPDFDVHTFLPYFPVLEAQDTRLCAHASRSLATWSSEMQTHNDGVFSLYSPSVGIQLNLLQHKLVVFSRR